MSVRARPRTPGHRAPRGGPGAGAAIITSQPASAHGSVTDPPSRNYGCWERWGSNHLDPTMEQKDPMCWQAWKADPNAMWNWNGLYREGVAGNHQAVIPTASSARAAAPQAPRYDALDAVGPWVAKGVPTSFTLTLTDGAKHGADYLRIYVTKAGFDPTTEAHRLGRPRPGQGDRSLRHHGSVPDRHEPVRPQRPRGPVHDLAGQPPRPVVLPVQRHQHRRRHDDAHADPDAHGHRRPRRPPRR